MPKLIGKLVIVFLIFASVTAGADSYEPVPGTNLTQAQIDRLVKYKNKVEASAYDVTMKLCQAYRQVTDKKPDQHKKWPYTQQQALGEWIKVIGRGLYQPIDGIAGIKGDLISARNLSLFDFDFWFGSAYVYYLIRSDKFFDAAFHCLADKIFKDKKVSSRPMDLFAATIVTFDYEATLLTEVGITLTLGKVIELLGKASKGLKWWQGLSKYTKRMFDKKMYVTSKFFVTPGHITMGSAISVAFWLAKIGQDKAKAARRANEDFREALEREPSTWENDPLFRLGLVTRFYKSTEADEDSVRACADLGQSVPEEDIQSFLELLAEDKTRVRSTVDDLPQKEVELLNEEEAFFYSVPNEYSDMIEYLSPQLSSCSG